mmetsp:Transcript_9489/g.8488  ORF Transcript_9489/g.8488 Transcript_9489/m.8488 type:complete len:158 (+) Transcript_9489:14-487(+)
MICIQFTIILFVVFLLNISCYKLNKFKILNLKRLYLSTIETTTDQQIERAVYITPVAMDHLITLHSKQTDKNLLRMGVKAGGCSGMSYVMDFIDQSEVLEDDYIEEFDSFKCVIDPKSLLYIFGMYLDYSNELIGGGFKFKNPNAETSCGCGKSFGV